MPMKNTITLDLNHSEKTRIEYFLNSVDGELEQIPFNVKPLQQLEEVIAGFKFKEKGKPTFITVIFATSYFNASAIATANSFHKMPGRNYTINGDILFVVESADEDELSQLLGLFAGKE